MSLDEQIATLVNASNSLTETVRTKTTEIDNLVVRKIEEIDEKILQVASTVPSAVLLQMNKVVYVDAEKIDDSGNGLTQGTAKKTVKEALKLLAPGAWNTVILTGGQTHVINDYSQLNGMNIVFTTSGLKPTLKSVQNTDKNIYQSYRQGLTSSTIVFEGINIETCEFTQSKENHSSLESAFFVAFTGHSKIFIRNSSLKLNNGVFLFQNNNSSFGFADVILTSVNIIKNESLAVTDAIQQIITSSINTPLGYRLHVSHVSFPSDETFGTLIGGDKSKIITNITF